MLHVLVLLAIVHGQPNPSEDALTHSIRKVAPKWRTVSFGLKYARQYASRILIEAERQGLDPIALTAIAWTESHFRPWAKGIPGTRRAAEVGVWQLIPRDYPLLMARKTLSGCKPPPSLPRWQVKRWVSQMKYGRCADQKVANRRKRTGNFSNAELKDYILSTYIAAFEIRLHIEFAKKRFRPRKIKGCKLPLKMRKKLYYYGHYNSGPKHPRDRYLTLICRRYATILRETRKFDRKENKK